MAAAQTPVAPTRLRLFRLTALAIFGLLAGRLWQIQFVRGDELQIQAAANRFVPREIEADRGVIYDASGEQVVLNRPRFTVSVVTAALPEDEAERSRAFRRLATGLDMPLRTTAIGRVGKTASAPASGGQGPDATADAAQPGLISLLPHDENGQLVASWEAVPVARNVPRSAAFGLMEAAADLPGVIVGEAPVREYPTGPTLSHILGFTGSIPEDELAAYRAQGYQIYDIVGRNGLEDTYEEYLRGTKGRKWVEVDAMGRELRTVGDPEPPAAGHSLHLTLELGFQQAVEDALVRGLRRVGARSGAVVVLDPRSGAVRAFVTWPTYDNNMFSTGASPEEFAALLADPDRPLVNRAISGQYPPGSVFKLVTASAALQEGVIKPSTRIFDPGVIYLPHEYDPSSKAAFPCWLRSGHGSLNVVGALAHSCDVFFYEVSGGYFEEGADQEGLGSKRLAQYARAFGLGKPTGIELLGEAAGRVPTREWLAEYNGEFWGTGETYFMGIGQSYNLVTPLQMANVTAAVANGGPLFQPHLVDRITDSAGQVAWEPGGVLGRLPVDAEYLALVREGMRGAVEWGTARRTWTGLPTQVSVAGKTGTAEFCEGVTGEYGPDCRRDRNGDLLTHAWFTAFAPVDEPEIALVVFVDGSGLDRIIEGSRDAAPIAAEVLRAWFKLPPPAPTVPAEAEEQNAEGEGE